MSVFHNITTKIYGITSALLSFTVLAGCGGGEVVSGGSTVIDPVIVDGDENAGTTVGSFSDTVTTDDADLVVISLATDGTNAITAGILDNDGDAITSGILTGSFDSTRSSITLTSGGNALLSNDAETEFVRVFRIQNTNNGGANTFGVFGIPTDLASIPTGSRTYGGHADLIFTRGDDEIRSVSGDVTVVVSFDDSEVTSDFFNLDEVNGISDVGRLSITGATLTGNSFSGGTATGTGLLDLDATAVGAGTGGQLYGPNADEVGGIVIVDTADLDILGVYVAE